MKPHIYFRNNEWVCESPANIACGDTPALAYTHWRLMFKFARNRHANG